MRTLQQNELDLVSGGCHSHNSCAPRNDCGCEPVNHCAPKPKVGCLSFVGGLIRSVFRCIC